MLVQPSVDDVRHHKSVYMGKTPALDTHRALTLMAATVVSMLERGEKIASCGSSSESEGSVSVVRSNEDKFC